MSDEKKSGASDKAAPAKAGAAKAAAPASHPGMLCGKCGGSGRSGGEICSKCGGGGQEPGAPNVPLNP